MIDNTSIAVHVLFLWSVLKSLSTNKIFLPSHVNWPSDFRVLKIC